MRWLGVCLLVGVLLSGTAPAQEPAKQDTQRENEELRRKNEELERRNAELLRKLREREEGALGGRPTAREDAQMTPPAEVGGPTPSIEAAPAAATSGSSPAEGKPAQGKSDGVLLGDMLVTATRGEAAFRTLGSTISVVSASALEESRTDEAIETLRDLPGIQIVRTGLKGGLTDVFTRGMNSNHTLVLLEGFELTRDGGQMFELDSFTTDGLGGAELLRGPQSALYGSDAMGGVINLRARRGAGPPRAKVSFQYGSYVTNHEKLDIQGGDPTFDYSLATSRFEQADGRFNNSQYRNVGALGRFDYRFNEKTSLLTLVRVQEDNLASPGNSSGPRFGPEDPDSHAEKDTTLLGLDFGHWVSAWWDAHLQVSHFTLNGDNFDRPDAADPFGDFQALSEYRKRIVHQYNRLHPVDWDTITVGLEYEDQELEEISNFTPGGTEEKRKDQSIYMQHELNYRDFVFLTGGFRYDDNESFPEPELTFRVAAAVMFEDTKTKPRASVGNAVVEPSFFATFDTQFGNPALGPERNFGWDVGVDQWFFGERLRVSASYFENDLEDSIQFRVVQLAPVFIGTFDNFGAAETKGVETEAHWQVGEGLLCEQDAVTASGSWSWLDTEITESIVPDDPSFPVGGSLLRRPRLTGSFTLDYQVKDSWGLNFNFNYTGRRKDRSFDFAREAAVGAREVVDSHARADLAGYWSVPWVPGLKAIARWENISNEDYDEALGFPAQRSTVLGGLEYELKF